MKPFLTLHHPARAKAYYDQGLWQDETFYDLLLTHADRTPDAPALRDGSLSLTWAELLQWTNAVAADFAAQGLGPGHRVSLWLSNRAEGVVTFLACSRAGLACNPSLHRTYACTEIAQLLNQLKTSILITEPGWGADRESTDLETVLKQVPSLKRIYQLPDFPANRPVDVPQVNGDPDTVTYLAFTSGTTGAPKCVMHSSNTLLANARDMVRDWELTSDARLLSLSPLSHHIAWVGVGQWLVSGCQFITDDPPQGTTRLDWLIDTRATYVMGVPTHAMDILNEREQRSINRLGAVETFYMAGAAIPPVLAENFVKLGVKPQNIYGMTENSSHQYTHPGDEPLVWTTTCGRGGPAYQVRIFDPENADRELPLGETGEIGGRGAALMLGYFDNQHAVDDSFNRDGWFLSGDLGTMDQAGNLKIDGRLKDLIIRGGHNIHPSRIEALALRHGGIEKAAAFPVADDRLGEKVCLAIIGTPGPSAVLDHLAAEGLSKFDMPEYFLALDALPLTPSGKILKRALVEMVKRGDISPQPVRYTAQKETA